MGVKDNIKKIKKMPEKQKEYFDKVADGIKEETLLDIVMEQWKFLAEEDKKVIEELTDLMFNHPELFVFWMSKKLLLISNMLDMIVESVEKGESIEEIKQKITPTLQ